MVAKNYFFILPFLLVLGYSNTKSTAQTTSDSLVIQVNDDEKSRLNLNSKVCILEDTTNLISFSQILSPTFQSKFLPFPSFQKQSPTLKKNRSYWAKMIFKNESSLNKWILYVGRASNIEFYSLNKFSKYQKKISGRAVPGSKRDIRSIIVESRYKFHLNLSQLKKTTIYIKILGNIHTPKFDLKIEPPDIFYSKSNQKKIIQSIFQGALWIILLYNLILYIIVKDRTYLYYVFYVFSHSLYYLGYYDLLNESPKAQILSAATASQTSMLFYFLFMRAFVNAKSLLPRWDRIVRIWIVIKILYTFIVGIYLFFTLNLLFASLLIVLSLFIEALFFLLTFFFLLKTRNVLAKYFIAGSFFLILGWVLSFIGFSELLKIDAVSNRRWGFENNYFTQAGIFLELVLFSVGLGYRERKNEEEKRLAQEENAKILREQNVVLEKKVKERTFEITEKNEELLLQKEEILAQRDALQERGEELQFAYNQITDSVRYAQTIQTAILPFEKKIQRVFDDYFIIFQPKDIVSGDFYWFNTIEDGGNTKTVVSVVDCTGHGVPGAFMSMIGNTLLNETINEKRIFNPAEVITRLHHKIRQDLRQAETNNSDGMDMALCVVEQMPDNQFKVTFSGAKRPLYYIQHGELSQLKSDRFSIGGEVYEDERERVFTNQEVMLQKGDLFYMMTDGFGDTPSPDRKRFGSRNIKKMLVAGTDFSMQEQKAYFETTLANHQGDQEARDDVTLLGFKL